MYNNNKKIIYHFDALNNLNTEPVKFTITSSSGKIYKELSLKGYSGTAYKINDYLLLPAYFYVDEPYRCELQCQNGCVYTAKLFHPNEPMVFGSNLVANKSFTLALRSPSDTSFIACKIIILTGDDNSVERYTSLVDSTPLSLEETVKAPSIEPVLTISNLLPLPNSLASDKHLLRIRTPKLYKDIDFKLDEFVVSTSDTECVLEFIGDPNVILATKTLIISIEESTMFLTIASLLVERVQNFSIQTIDQEYHFDITIALDQDLPQRSNDDLHFLDPSIKDIAERLFGASLKQMTS